MPLQVKVTPDIVVDENTILTPEVLNRLATPTVDVTGTVDGVSSANISDNAVDNAKLANMLIPNSVKGVGAGGGDPRDLALDQTLTATDGPGVTGTLKVADGKIGSTQLAPKSVGTANIIDQAVTREKIETQAPASLLGNPDVNTAPPEQITLGAGLFISAVTLVSVQRGRAANVATIDFSDAGTPHPHGLSQGEIVNITGGTGTDATFNGFHVAIKLVPTPSSFTYDNTGDPVTLTNFAGLKVRRINQATISAAHEVSVVSTTPQQFTGTFAGAAKPTWESPDVSMKKFMNDTVEFGVTYTPKVNGSTIVVDVISPIRYTAGQSGGSYTGWLALFKNPLTPSDTAVITAPNFVAELAFGTALLSYSMPIALADVGVPLAFRLKFSGGHTNYNGQGNLAGWTPQTIMRVREIFP